MMQKKWNKKNGCAVSVGLSLLLVASQARSGVDTPVLQGLGGAGRAVVANESLYQNPAAAIFAQGSTSYLYYSKSSLPESNSGGKSITLGAVDGDNPIAKGAAGFTRTSRARISRGRVIYEDRKEFRLSMAQAITQNVAAGAGGRYVIRGDGPVTKKFFQADAGLVFPVFADLRAGLTYENIDHKGGGEEPPTLGAGAHYKFGSSFSVFADGTQIMKGTQKKERSWALAGEASIWGDLFLRMGRFKSAFRGYRGTSLGLGWSGPRMSLEYAYRKTKHRPTEKDHIFGFYLRF